MALVGQENYCSTGPKWLFDRVGGLRSGGIISSNKAELKQFQRLAGVAKMILRRLAMLFGTRFEECSADCS